MALLSGVAARHIGRRALVPMQFGLNGQPVWSVPRRFALLFAPCLAAVSGLVLTFLAHRDTSGMASAASAQLALIRAAMAFTFVVAHMVHLAIALRWLNRNGPR